MVNARTLALGLVAALVTGCGGGGSAPTPTTIAPVVPSGKGSAVKARIVVAPTAPPAPKIRKPKFVSPSTAGISIVVYAQSDTNHTTILGQSATDISPGSPACTTGPPRTCTASVVAPFGADDFVITTYDEPPNGSSFSSAHVLGTSSAMLNVVSGANNALSVFVQGSVANLSATPAFASLAANGTSQSLAIIVAAADYDDNPISAGPNDPYANPISVSLVETGGSGHAVLLFDGASAGTSATLSKSSDTIAVQYDGAGSPGYSATTTFSASGVSSQTVQLSPMYATGSGPFYAAGAIAFTAPGQTSPVTLSEAGFTGTYAATPSSCTGDATAAVSGSVVTITAGANAVSPGACSVALSDGVSTLTVGVATTVSTATVTVLSGGVTITEYSGLTGQSWWIAPGPDGNMWFTEVGNDKVGKITPTGVIQEYSGQSSEPFQIAAGDDGNMWYTLLTGNAIGRITTGGTVTVFSGPQLPWGIAQGSDGNIWFGTQNSCCPTPATIGFITPVGTLNYWAMSGAGFQELALGPDGNMWFTDDSNNAVGKLTTGGVYTEFTIPTASSSPFGIAAGPDGNIWFCENATNKIGKVTLAGAFTEYLIPTAGAGCYGMAAGPDGNLWFAESTANKIAKVSTSGVFTEYPVPTAGAQPTQVAPGANGTIWFTEQGTSNIGVLQY